MREVDTKAWPAPTPQMLSDPRFEAVWQCIKRWDISVPDAYSGYEGATGNHVRAILDAIQPAWLEIERLRRLVNEAIPGVDVQAIAAIAWRCIRECKDYEGPPVMCPAHQEEARALVAKCDEPAKPEVGPMQDAESLSGVQALGSSGLAQMPTEREISDAIVAGIQDKPEAQKLCWDIVCRVKDYLEARRGTTDHPSANFSSARTTVNHVSGHE